MAATLIPVELNPVHVSCVDRSFARSGVYFLIHKGSIVYVGQSGSVLRRIGEHMADRTKIFEEVAFIPCSAANRLWMESAYIEKHRPIYNSRDAELKARLRPSRTLQRPGRARKRARHDVGSMTGPEQTITRKGPRFAVKVEVATLPPK